MIARIEITDCTASILAVSLAVVLLVAYLAYDIYSTEKIRGWVRRHRSTLLFLTLAGTALVACGMIHNISIVSCTHVEFRRQQ